MYTILSVIVRMGTGGRMHIQKQFIKITAEVQKGEAEVRVKQ